MDLPSDDKHTMQLDSNYIPNPAVNDRLSSRFDIPITMNIAFYQVLESGRLLLILLDQHRVAIYLDHLPALNVAIKRDRPVKILNREKLGEESLFAFDESTRSLLVCASTKVSECRFLKGINHDIFSNSCDSTCSFSMKATRYFRHKAAPLI
jgi:hypothetical protein